MQLGYDVAKYGIQQIKWDYGWWSDEIVTGQWSEQTRDFLRSETVPISAF